MSGVLAIAELRRGESEPLGVRPVTFELIAAGRELAQQGAGSLAPRLELALAGRARTERVELREAPIGEVDIAKANFLLSIGRGVGAAEQVARMERLADALGATLAVSGPLVEAGWASRARKV